jgi:hypothetical protein
MALCSEWLQALLAGGGWPLAATSRCARRAGRPDGQRTTRRARSLARRTDRVINDQLFEPLDLLTESLDLVLKTGLVARQFVDVIFDCESASKADPSVDELQMIDFARKFLVSVGLLSARILTPTRTYVAYIIQNVGLPLDGVNLRRRFTAGGEMADTGAVGAPPFGSNRTGRSF